MLSCRKWNSFKQKAAKKINCFWGKKNRQQRDSNAVIEVWKIHNSIFYKKLWLPFHWATKALHVVSEWTGWNDAELNQIVLDQNFATHNVYVIICIYAYVTYIVPECTHMQLRRQKRVSTLHLINNESGDIFLVDNKK